MAAPMFVTLPRQSIILQRFVRDLRSKRCIQCTAQCFNKDRKESSSSMKTEKISSAMKSYLKTASEYEKKMDKFSKEYEDGRRHLANIMGLEVEFFTKEHVKTAVSYLMPSGLFSRKARPAIMEAHEIIPRKKAPQFGMDGRPHHHMFYTAKPNFHEVMLTISLKMEKLKRKEDEMFRVSSFPVFESPLKSIGTDWLQFKAFTNNMMEDITVQEYNRFVKLMQRLFDHPLSYLEEDFIQRYRRTLPTFNQASIKPKMKVNEDGSEYAEARGSRKRSKAVVRLQDNGTGLVTINKDYDLSYFKDFTDRHQIMFPLVLTGKLGLMDMDIEVRGGGPTGQAGAIRIALAKTLLCFVTDEMVRKMIVTGLLTTDPRRRERKKYGQKGARKKFAWRKR